MRRLLFYVYVHGRLNLRKNKEEKERMGVAKMRHSGNYIDNMQL
jgi:hypothetical protein